MTFTCKDCGYVVNTFSYLCYHRREKHTHSDCIVKICGLCEKQFYSPENYPQKKCQECRDLQRNLNTNDLVHETYVYNENKRYYVDKGFVTQVCSIYDCEKDLNCEHMQKQLTTCQGSKCLKMFVANGYNFCDCCRNRGHVSKNKTRDKTIKLKQTLGGKCVDCHVDTLYILEFDHIDPSKKTKQITRMSPNDWHKEIDNIALRCANCHRIKSYKELKEKHKDAPNSRKKTYNEIILKQIHHIKKQISACQICGWNTNIQDDLCVVLEFDHINDDKDKQVSLIVTLKNKLKEIIKCRCICRACHQITTCMQRDGIMLQLQMSEEEYKELYDKYMNKDTNKRMNDEVYTITKQLYQDQFPEIFKR